MNKILVLGTGLQGKAALYDLAHNPKIGRIFAADARIQEAEEFAATLPPGRVKCVQVEASNLDQVASLFELVDLVIMLLPNRFAGSLLPLAVEHKIHWIDASYAQKVHADLDDAARRNGTIILPEFGLDPGIDLLLAAKAIGEMDEVEEIFSYGAGLPEPDAADNALRYRVSWTFAGVLAGYSRDATLVIDGEEIVIPAEDIFANENIHHIKVEGIGKLEAYPNGNARRYVKMLALPSVKNAGRYSMRWPGHAAFWHIIARMGLLKDELRTTEGKSIHPRVFLQEALEPQLQYEEKQRDVAIVVVDVGGSKNGKRRKLRYQVVDYRDLQSGLMAMQRTVGFTAAIGAQMILENEITKRGLLSPLTDVPVDRALGLLAERGIEFSRIGKTNPD